MSTLETAIVDGVEVAVLYRPTGQPEMDLVVESGYSKWPPRLPEQPIFYPVLNEAYATEIAQRWNTQDSANGNIGYVTKFFVKLSFINKYKTETVGASHHVELWIPAEELDEMNQNLVGPIQVLSKIEE